ncbi:hypothetical protein CIPAW_11G078300 [Carya illinoinensis]|uniref:Uncharacterized protein n=1 Tax=Carya illinoinensis TaxID=32201 RepID=A0A8T1NWJ1_CARIL|nr:hypothetical protein CIPAW_11G078300 [Carya illinoinensis]
MNIAKCTVFEFVEPSSLTSTTQAPWQSISKSAAVESSGIT